MGQWRGLGIGVVLCGVFLGSCNTAEEELPQEPADSGSAASRGTPTAAKEEETEHPEDDAATPTAKPATPTVTASESSDGFGSCRPHVARSGTDGFFAWARTGEWIVFESEDRVMAVTTSGSRLLTLSHEPHSTWGFHAGLGPDGLTVVLSTCRFRKAGESNDAGPQTSSRHPSETYEDYWNRFEHELMSVEIGSSSTRRLTENASFEQYPVWSPDGTRIAFLRRPEGKYWYDFQLATMSADGSGERNIAPGLSGRVVLAPPQWSPDGRQLAFLVQPEKPYRYPAALYVVEEGGGVPQHIGESDTVVSWSPDGQRLAFGKSDADGGYGLYTSGPDGSDTRLLFRQDSDDPIGGDRTGIVAWSPDGSEILYVFGNLRPFGEKVNPFASFGIYVVRADGTSVRRIEFPIRAHVFGVAWSPDGLRIAVHFYLGIGSRWVLTVPRSATRIGGETSIEGPGVQVLARVGRQDEPVIMDRFVAAAPVPGPAVDPGTCSAGVVVPEPEANAGLVADCEVLLAARDTLAGGATLLWGQGPISEWEGVTVGGDPPRVRELDLRGYTLTGTIPREFARLSELRLLDLSYNLLTGDIVPGLARLEQLRRLDLSNNVLSGTLPRELASLTRLESLDLGYNRLTGTIPPEWTRLRSLGRLAIRPNQQVGGCLPAGLPEESPELRTFFEPCEDTRR